MGAGAGGAVIRSQENCREDVLGLDGPGGVWFGGSYSGLADDATERETTGMVLPLRRSDNGVS